VELHIVQYSHSVKCDERGEVVEKGEEGERNSGEMLYYEEYEYIYRAKNSIFKKKGDDDCSNMED
jgi:hypothetical protein